MATGTMTLERMKTAQLLERGIRFFLTAALTASRTPGGFAPFALGCVAAAEDTWGISLAGAAMGALLFLPFEEALPFLAVALLIVTTEAAFQGTKLAARPRFLPLVSAGLVLAVGSIYAVQSLSPAEQLAECMAAAGLTGAAAWFFRGLLAEEPRRQEGVLFLAAALLLAVQEVRFFGLSAGRALLCALLLYTAYERGALTGASVGLGLGLTADLCAGTGTGLLTAGLGLAGLAAGSRTGGNRLAAAGMFWAAAGVALLPSAQPEAWTLLLEAAVGAGTFLLLPRKVFGGKRVRRAESSETAVSRRLKEQMLKTAAALRELYDCMGRGGQTVNDENPAIIFDRAAEKVCRECALCGLCWQREYTGTFNALNDATPYLLERGRVLRKDFPPYFVQRCIHLSEFMLAVNGEVSAFLLRRQYRRQLEETRRSAQGQYAQLSELLTATAAGLGEAAIPGGGGGIQVGAAIRAKEGECVCGDTVVSFRTESGRWCLLLADGMGSGEPARKESALTCRLLRQFLEAGIEPEAALKTLNAAMALRGAETGSFTTVDLCICDSGAGEAVFYKYGAAPSYIKKGGAVRRITGVGLPVGLRGTPAMPDVTRMALEPGSFAVLVSDGVADADRDDWLQDLLAGWQGEDPQELADLILAESVRRERLRDDCGIQVLYRPQERKSVAAV